MKIARFVFSCSMLAAGACGTDLLPYDAGTPPIDAGKTCDGVCLHGPPAEWFGPTLVWMGDEASAPECPMNAPSDIFAGHGYVEGPIACDACTCGPPSGDSCDLSATVTVAAASCAGNGSSVAHTSFNPPAGWTGACNGENAIPAGKLCGGVPCVQSVTIAPLTPKQTGCLPSPNTNASPPPWNRFARGCSLLGPQDRCDAAAGLCTPAAPGPEFKQCILKTGVIAALDCPPSYPERSIFYHMSEPACAPCACDVPTSTCVGSIELFQDGSCSTPLGDSISIDAKGPVCVDVPPGSALGSKVASKGFYTAGTCKPSGGAPEGTVFCCQP
jgi:hypothetical protein